MPKKIFYLNPDQVENLEISWGFSWKKTVVKFNGTELGVFKNQAALKKGANFQLDEKRMLQVKLKGAIYPELELLVNGKEIFGSPTEPAAQLKQVVNFAFGIGILSLAAGLVAEVLRLDFLLAHGIGLGNIIFGAIIIGLAFWLKKKSVIALTLIIGLIVADAVGTFILSINSGTQINPSTGIMLKLFFLFYLIQGFQALKKLKANNPKIVAELI